MQEKMTGRLHLFLRQNVVFYLAGFLIICAFRHAFWEATSDGLDWLLYPTARWVQWIGGIPFERAPGAGYVNHHLRFIIAAPCSGIRFMMITFSALLFSFVHRFGAKTQKSAWAALSLGLSYLFTIVVNGVRMILALGYPAPAFGYGWAAPEKYHMLQGMSVYLLSLFAIYQIADHATGKRGASRRGKSGGGVLAGAARACAAPVFWYLLFMLAIPALNRWLWG